MKKYKYLLFVLIIVVSYNTFSQNVPANDVKYPLRLNVDPEEIPIFSHYAFLYFDKFTNQLFCTDFVSHKIKILGENLNLIKEFGRFGQGPLEFNQPTGISSNSNSVYIVTDFGNQRIQILDKKYEINSIIRLKTQSPSWGYALIDNKNNIWLNCPLDGHLLSVYDLNGDIVKSFGELYDTTIKKGYSPVNQNQICYLIDEKESIYMAYREKPVLRKYDKNFNLIFETSLKDFEEIKQAKREKDDLKLHIYYVYVIHMQMDENFLYLLLGVKLEGNNPIYPSTIAVFSKNTGKFVKKITLHYSKKQKEGRIVDFALSDKYIYAFDQINCEILKYLK